LQNISSSPVELVTKLYPEHKWKLWKFTSTPRGLWKKLGSRFATGESEARELVSQFIADLASQCGIHSLETWKYIICEGLSKRKSKELPKEAAAYFSRLSDVQKIYDLGGLAFVLKSLHPHHNWNLNPAPNNNSRVKRTGSIRSCLAVIEF